jgi:Fe-S cluster assembly ATP-binding protein
MAQALLFVEDVHVEKNGSPILRGVTLQVRPGEIVGVLGRNGAGKSSLAYSIMGIGRYRPSRGQIQFDGEDILPLSVTDRARRGISLAWQHPARYEGISVRDYLRLSSQRVTEGMMEDALARVMLDPSYLDRMVDKSLSGGERKRIELASVFLMHPRLSVLDEPDSGVDLLALGEIMTLFRTLSEGGNAVLIITHREDVAAACDRSYLMCGGRMILEGSAEAVKRYFLSQCSPCTELQPEIVKEVC